MYYVRYVLRTLGDYSVDRLCWVLPAERRGVSRSQPTQSPGNPDLEFGPDGRAARRACRATGGVEILPLTAGITNTTEQPKSG